MAYGSSEAHGAQCNRQTYEPGAAQPTRGRAEGLAEEKASAPGRCCNQSRAHTGLDQPHRARHGGNFSLDSWQLICLAVGRRLEFRLPADTLQEPADAGHLAIQELVLRLGRTTGFRRTFELPTRPADPMRSA